MFRYLLNCKLVNLGRKKCLREGNFIASSGIATERICHTVEPVLVSDHLDNLITLARFLLLLELSLCGSDQMCLWSGIFLKFSNDAFIWK